MNNSYRDLKYQTNRLFMILKHLSRETVNRVSQIIDKNCLHSQLIIIK